ncbi:hypothetical protein CLOM_g5975 [Closterium sp. NIES-68]|nr:hypothetical protein CLOM_g5975 [Closterium sp. NIES-68]GJP86373.1 hypothetical protein CLOP_g16400 [Closterium sp. NIES-67]
MADAAARREARRRRILNQGNERLRFITGDSTAMLSQSQSQSQPPAATDAEDTAAPARAEPAAPAVFAPPSASPSHNNLPASPPLSGPALPSPPSPPSQPQPHSTPETATPMCMPAQAAAVSDTAEPAAVASPPAHPPGVAPSTQTFPFDPLAPSALSSTHLPFLSAQLAQQQQGLSVPLLGARHSIPRGAFGSFQEPVRAQQQRSAVRLLLSMQQVVLAAHATAVVRLVAALLLALLYCMRMLPLHCPHLLHSLPGIAASTGGGAEATDGVAAPYEASFPSQQWLLSFLFFLPAHPCLTVLATDAALIASSLVLQTFTFPRAAHASPAGGGAAAGLAGLLRGLSAAAREGEGGTGRDGSAGEDPLREMMGMVERTGYWVARAGMVRDVLHGLLLNLSVFLVALGCAMAVAEAAGQHATCGAMQWGVGEAVRHAGGLVEMCQAVWVGVKDTWTAVLQPRG